jgi:hypothetical protein
MEKSLTRQTQAGLKSLSENYENLPFAAEAAPILSTYGTAEAVP